MAGSQILTDGPEILFQAFIEHRDRHVIHSGSTFVGGDLRERRKQCAFGVDFVDQAEPLASFDPLFEGRQHPRCPNPRFDPAPSEQDLSGTCVALAGTASGCSSVDLVIASPPSCTPSLHQHYPASSLLWAL